jgi:hypothetical protein
MDKPISYRDFTIQKMSNGRYEYTHGTYTNAYTEGTVLSVDDAKEFIDDYHRDWEGDYDYMDDDYVQDEY